MHQKVKNLRTPRTLAQRAMQAKHSAPLDQTASPEAVHTAGTSRHSEMTACFRCYSCQSPEH